MSRNLRQYICILIVYLVYIFLLTFAPYDFSVTHFKGRMGLNLDIIKAFVAVNGLDMVLNVLVFMPFGFITRKIMLYGKRGFKSIWFILLFSLILSGSIETIQLFLSRHTSIPDIMTNTLGGIWGSLLAPYLSRENLIRRLPFIKYKLSHWLILMLYGFFLFEIIRVPIQNNQQLHWDENYPLVIGNETTGDRPWEGEIHFLGVYDYVFSMMHVTNHYFTYMGFKPRPLFIDEHSLALYTFFEGTGDTVHNLASTGNPLHLTGEEFKWLKNQNGIALKGRGVHSLGEVKSMVQGVGLSGEFSIALVVQPNDTIQTGPARIFSNSMNQNLRNFTVGQMGRDLIFRVRTLQAGANGSNIYLHAPNVFNLEPIHLVLTFKKGVSKLFVNGELSNSHTSILRNYLPDSLGLGFSSFGYFSSVFMLWFPFFIFLFFLQFRRQWIHFPIASLIAGFFANFILHQLLGEPIQWDYMFYIVLTTAFVVCYALVYDKD